MDDYTNGYVQKVGGKFEGELTIEGINLQGGITAVYFSDGGENYLWLRRKRVLDYDYESQTYREREARPKWEAYLKKCIDDGVVSYKGEFVFMRMKFSIVGVWDSVLGIERSRLNLFVERLPMQEQSIINSINESRTNGK